MVEDHDGVGLLEEGAKRGRITLQTENLSYYLPARRKRGKALLKDVTLSATPGRLLYVMGPSGAGKSTLLDLLAGRITKGSISGEVYFNGIPQRRAQRTVSRCSAYIRQDDLHLPMLTVRETLNYAARFHMACDSESRTRRVDEVARLLGLTEILQSRVGGQFNRGISGGQMKRLSIAVEIMQMPTLLYLDEPTSGLDAVMAQEVMLFVSKLCTTGNATVISTIHQPSEEVLGLSHDLVLLAEGRVCYAGPTSDAVTFLTHTCAHLIEPGQGPEAFSNPADFLISVISTPAAEQIYLQHTHTHTYTPPPTHTHEPLPPSPGPRTFLLSQIRTLLSRGFLVSSRERVLLRTVLTREIFTGLLYGLVFLQQGNGQKASAGVLGPYSFNTASLLYFSTYCLLWLNMESLGQYFFWRGIYHKERDGQAYSALAFLVASPLFMLPYLFLFYLVFVLLTASMAGLYDQLTAGTPILAYLITLLTTYFLATSVAARLKKPELAFVVVPIVFVLMGNLTGFIVTRKNMPNWLEWFSYIAYTRYCWQANMLVQFKHRTDRDVVLENFGFHDSNFDVWGCIGVLCGFMCGFALILYYELLPSMSRLRTVKAEEKGSGGNWANQVKGGGVWANGKRAQGGFWANGVRKRQEEGLDTPLLLQAGDSGGREGDDEDDHARVHRGNGYVPVNGGVNGHHRGEVQGDGGIGCSHGGMGGGGGGSRSNGGTGGIGGDGGVNNSHGGTAGVGVGGSSRRSNGGTDGGGTGGNNTNVEPAREGAAVAAGEWGVLVNDDDTEQGLHADDGGTEPLLRGSTSSLSQTSGTHTHTHAKTHTDDAHAHCLTLKDFAQRSSLVPRGNSGHLYFRDIGYSIVTGRKRVPLTVLHGGISGVVGSTEMMALMGPSGAGKTTLLDILAGRKTVGSTSGQVLATGGLRGRSSYVTQDDVHLSTLTVRETLVFAARLRLEEEVPWLERMERVELIESMLGLEGARDVLVGDAFHKGISGGQMRRLTIGVEIINLPDLLFLDEPTTGLDSTMALEVMSAVRSLCDRDRTVVCTIHQPSREIYELFDRLTLLSGGRLAYHGPAAEAVEYFASAPLYFDPSNDSNPADLVIRVASCTAPRIPPSSSDAAKHLESAPNQTGSGPSIPTTTTTTTAAQQLPSLSPTYLSEAFRRSSLGMSLENLDLPDRGDLLRMQREWSAYDRKERGGEGGRGGEAARVGVLNGGTHAFAVEDTHEEKKRKRRRYPRTLWAQIYLLNVRQLTKIAQDRRSLIINNLNYLILGLFCGVLYGRPGQDSQTKLGVLYSSTMVVTFTNQHIIPVLYSQRPLLYRERGAKVYSTIAHCLSVDTPYILVNATTALIYSLLIYAMTPVLDGPGQWGFHYLTMVLTSYTSLNLVEFLSSVLPSSRELSAVWSFVGYIVTVFSGYMSRLPALPQWITIVTYLSFTRWSLQAMAVNVFEQSDPAFLCELGYDGWSKWWSIAVLAALVVSFRIGMVVFTTLWTFEKR